MVVGKAPEPGRTKTRLVPPLTATEAADLYRAFLRDTLAFGLSLGWTQVSLVYPPSPDAANVLAQILPPGVALCPQRGRGLGAALTGAFSDYLAAGFQEVVLIGSDTPDLPADIVAQASRQLATADLTVGPSPDGGYYLIGMRRPHLGVFRDITWSTDRVYRETLARAAALGLRVAPLPEWPDVDRPDDLARLRADLAAAAPGVAPATRAALGIVRHTAPV